MNNTWYYPMFNTNDPRRSILYLPFFRVNQPPVSNINSQTLVPTLPKLIVLCLYNFKCVAPFSI